MATHQLLDMCCHRLDPSYCNSHYAHFVQLCSLEEAVADRQAELQDVLAAHAAMHQTQELAKAELATVEQQLLVQRAARNAQLEQHASQVGPQYQTGLQRICTRHSCLAVWTWSLFDCTHFVVTQGASCNCTNSNWPGFGSAL